MIRTAAQFLTAIVLLASAASVAHAADDPVAAIRWRPLPSIPNPVGLAGGFVGVSDEALVVAGGANFPDEPPWSGGSKAWRASVHVLRSPTSEWQTLADSLPAARAYGISATWNDAIACVGGSDAERHFRDAYLLRLDGAALTVEPLPDLPKARANGAGALISDVLYVACGSAAPDATSATRTLFALHLAAPRSQRAWKTLAPLPGAARIFPGVATLGGRLYVYGGARLVPGDDGETTREFLRDGYAYDPADDRWSRIADLPEPVCAPPNPAMTRGATQFLTLAGDDGEFFFQQAELEENHPGFPTQLYSYNAVTDRWAASGEFPKLIPFESGPHGNAGTWPAVTTAAAWWRDHYTIVSGEARPGVRTPRVYWAVETTGRRSFGAVNWIVLLIYLASLVVIGAWCARLNRTPDDYFLAGRRIPWWAAGLSIFGTVLSAITFLALPARSFATAWYILPINFAVVAVAPLVIYVYVPMLRRLQVTTAFEYLGLRFGNSLRRFGAMAFVLLQLGRMGIVVLLPALALSAVTGLNVYACILLMGLLATLYTVLGGIEAVIWTDVVQVVVLLAGAVIAVVVAAGGVEGGLAGVARTGAASAKFAVADSWWGLVGETLPVLLLTGIFSSGLIPYVTDQAAVQRYLTTPNEKSAQHAVWTAALMVIPATLLFLFVGTTLFAFYQQHPARLQPMESVDQVFAAFIAYELPTGVAGLVIAGVFAAAMSSLDSSMHSAATTIMRDLVPRRDRGASAVFRTARLLTAALGGLGTGVACAMAAVEIRFLFDHFLKIIGIFGGPLAGVFLLGLLVRRAGWIAAWSGITAGCVAVATVMASTAIDTRLAGAAGALACIAAGAIVAPFEPQRGGASSQSQL